MHATLFFLSLLAAVLVLFENSVKKSVNCVLDTIGKPPQIVVRRGHIKLQKRCSVDKTARNFVKCLSVCAKMESCQICHFSENCNLCAECVFYPDISSPHIIGMKNLNNATTDLCPEEPTAFNYTTQYPANTTTTLPNTPTQSTKTLTTTPKCPSTYEMFQREKNWTVCLGIEHTPVFTKITHDQGVGLCANGGGFISGPDTLMERKFLMDQSSKIFSSFLNEGVGLWLDGSRTNLCAGNACNTIKAFNFSDVTLLKRDGYSFYFGQPDGALTLQNCLQMMIKTNLQNGQLDDQVCTALNGYFVMSRGVVCGKLIV